MNEPTSPAPTAQPKPECFAIMPVSDPEGYEKGHFRHVYDDLIRPACEKAGFSAVLASDVKETNLIHVDILQRLLVTPMAVCDLSSRNPNVMFELALRQSFDKPVALIQESGTPPVFDVAPLRAKDYHKGLMYHEVILDQRVVSETIRETFDAHQSGRGVNSIVKLLALGKKARLPEMSNPEAAADFQQLILSEISNLREELRASRSGYTRTAADESTDLLLDGKELLRRALEAEKLADGAMGPDEIAAIASTVDAYASDFRKLLDHIPVSRDVPYKVHGIIKAIDMALASATAKLHAKH